MPLTPDQTIAELRPPTSATSRRMTPGSRLSRERRWSRRSRLRGGRSPSIRIRGPNIGSSRRIALSMTPRLLAWPGSVPLRSCTSGLSKRYDTWRYTDGPFVEDRPLAAVRRGDRHAHLTGSREAFAPPAPFTLDEPERPYTKEELHAYLVHLRQKCQTTIAELSDEKAHQQFTFPWPG